MLLQAFPLQMINVTSQLFAPCRDAQLCCTRKEVYLYNAISLDHATDFYNFHVKPVEGTLKLPQCYAASGGQYVKMICSTKGRKQKCLPFNDNIWARLHLSKTDEQFIYLVSFLHYVTSMSTNNIFSVILKHDFKNRKLQLGGVFRMSLVQLSAEVGAAMRCDHQEMPHLLLKV